MSTEHLSKREIIDRLRLADSLRVQGDLKIRDLIHERDQLKRHVADLESALRDCQNARDSHEEPAF